MGINYTDGVKIPCSCFLFLRKQPVAASPLTPLQQIRLARVCDRWWAHASHPLWSCVIRTQAGKRKLWSASFEGRKNVTSTGSDCRHSQGWPPGQGHPGCKDGAELLHDAARTAGRAVPRAGREAVQTFGIPECCIPRMYFVTADSTPRAAWS